VLVGQQLQLQGNKVHRGVRVEVGAQPAQLLLRVVMVAALAVELETTLLATLL
jgi:hypothetical protein